MNIAVQAAVVANRYLPLDVAEGANRTEVTDHGVLSNHNSMTGVETVSYCALRIDQGVTSNKGFGPDHRKRVLVIAVMVVSIQWLADFAVVADCTVVADDHVVIDDGVISYPYIPANSGQRTNADIPGVEFHQGNLICYISKQADGDWKQVEFNLTFGDFAC